MSPREHQLATSVLIVGARGAALRAALLDIAALPSWYATRLLVDDGSVFGAYGFDVDDGSRVLIHDDATILATGGYSRIRRQTSARRHENAVPHCAWRSIPVPGSATPSTALCTRIFAP